MFFSIDDLKACVKDGIPCEYLKGNLIVKPIIVSCGLGNNCKVCECCFYKIEEQRNSK